MITFNLGKEPALRFDPTVPLEVDRSYFDCLLGRHSLMRSGEIFGWVGVCGEVPQIMITSPGAAGTLTVHDMFALSQKFLTGARMVHEALDDVFRAMEKVTNNVERAILVRLVEIVGAALAPWMKAVKVCKADKERITLAMKELADGVRFALSEKMDLRTDEAFSSFMRPILEEMVDVIGDCREQARAEVDDRDQHVQAA